eukprot:354017-Rhodomonas_salina.1
MPGGSPARCQSRKGPFSPAGAFQGQEGRIGTECDEHVRAHPPDVPLPRRPRVHLRPEMYHGPQNVPGQKSTRPETYRTAAQRPKAYSSGANRCGFSSLTLTVAPLRVGVSKLVAP